ncbi:hypothetical protein J6590_084404 [Homalodisca vitripennis]|nr:hypothetical protein J6590_084404 [Homalodisca vitripennis]
MSCIDSDTSSLFLQMSKDRTDSHTIIRRKYFVKKNVLQELNASRAEIVIRWEEQINEAAALHRPPGHWGSCGSTPRLSHPSAMATSGPLLDFGKPYHIIPWTTDHGLHALLLTRRGAWTLFVGSRQVKQLIEMSTVIRSRSGWFEREGAVLECRRQGADVQLRSSSSSSNPLVWDIE